MYYSAYYRQRKAGYEKLSYGICSIYKQERKKNESCKTFKLDELREKKRKASLYLYLEQAAKSINDIIDIIKEKENIKDD